MNARGWKPDVIVQQQNDERIWELDVQREYYDHMLKTWEPFGPVLLISAQDDPYYCMEFTSRAAVRAFIRQLQEYADEVWPGG